MVTDARPRGGADGTRGDGAAGGDAEWGGAPVRAGLLLLTLVSLLVGPWAQLAPDAFWRNFPAWGLGWVSTDGPYNGHLVRDVGGLQLGMAVVLLAALLRPTRRLVLVAALASVAWQGPHTVYHLLHAGDLPTAAERAAQSALLLVPLAVATALLVAALRRSPSAAAVGVDRRR